MIRPTPLVPVSRFWIFIFVPMSGPDFDSFYLGVINRGFELSYVKLQALTLFFMGPDLIRSILSSPDHKFCLALRTIDVGFRFRFHTSRPSVKKVTDC